MTSPAPRSATTTPVPTSYPADKGSVEDATFLALADPTRRYLIRRIVTDAPVTATELASGLPISRQAVAKHLALLRSSGLVSVERRGRERRYRLIPRPLTEAAAWLRAVEAEWDGHLDALERHLAAHPNMPHPEEA